jgi:hypothetical protein
MRALQSQISITSLVMAMGNARQAKELVSREAILKAMQPTTKVVIDAFMRGGKLGAKHIEGML